MNENLNLVEILKDCPKGTELYSTIYGKVKLYKINEEYVHPISLTIKTGEIAYVTSDGKHLYDFDGDCILFPSKEQRDWSKFKPKEPKFDPKTLKPFDKVLVRDEDNEKWNCGFFSHKNEFNNTYPYRCVGTPCTYCIPYNDETKHLVGTNEEAPEFYKYWED